MSNKDLWEIVKENMSRIHNTRKETHGECLASYLFYNNDLAVLGFINSKFGHNRNTIYLFRNGKIEIVVDKFTNVTNLEKYYPIGISEDGKKFFYNHVHNKKIYKHEHNL